MKTYSLDLRHAASKRKLNALPDNRLPPLRRRVADDAAAVAWARGELIEFGRVNAGEHYQYVEAALSELLPFGEIVEAKDYRRLGRWVFNADGLIWREAGAEAMVGT